MSKEDGITGMRVAIGDKVIAEMDVSDKPVVPEYGVDMDSNEDVFYIVIPEGQSPEDFIKKIKNADGIILRGSRTYEEAKFIAALDGGTVALMKVQRGGKK